MTGAVVPNNLNQLRSTVFTREGIIIAFSHIETFTMFTHVTSRFFELPGSFRISRIALNLCKVF